MEYDLHNSVLQKVAMTLTAGAITSDTTTPGLIIDTLGFESVEFIVESGTLIDGTYTVILLDGDDSGLSDSGVIDPELVLGDLPVFTATADNTAKRVGTITKKRYVRLNIASTGTTTGGNLSSVAILGNPHTRPTAAA